MNDDKRNFDLGTIISITSGRMFTQLNNIYDILSYLTNRNIYTHQVQYVSELAKYHILEKYPMLEGVGAYVSISSEEEAISFINEQKKIYGESLTLNPINKEIISIIDSMENSMFKEKFVGNITIKQRNPISTTCIEQLKPKEIISQLHDVANEIVYLYYQLMKKNHEDINNDENLELMTKLKLFILKENHIIKSIPKDKILLCRLAIKGEEEFIKLHDPTIEFNLSDDEVFEFPSNEPSVIYDRISMRLYNEQKLHEGEVVLLNETMSNGEKQRIELGYLDCVSALIDIKLIKSLKEQFEKGYTNIEMNAELNKNLRKKLNDYFIFSLMNSHILEIFTFLFSSSINIEQVLDSSFDKIESILFNYHEKNTINVIGNIGTLVIEKLTTIDIDVSNSNLVLMANSDVIFEYILNITKLDIILSYADEYSCKKIEHFLDTVEIENGIEFKSKTVKQIIRDMVKKHKSRIL